MARICVNLDASSQEWPQGISQEASKYYLKYEVGKIFESLSYHPENEAIYPTIFSDTEGLGDRIKG